MGLPPLLPESFYGRDALVVARDLVGKEIRRGPVRLRITEVEAYCFPDDTANHARFGHTRRNRPMWGPPGRAYVYLCYGIHWMLNLVTNADGEAAAVLVRAAEPIAGLGRIRQRRQMERDGPVLLTGPGKVGQALGLDGSFNDHLLYRSGGLEVRDGEPPGEILHGPRVGIDYAAEEHRWAPWRVAAGGTRWVSRPNHLRGEALKQRRPRRRTRS